MKNNSFWEFVYKKAAEKDEGYLKFLKTLSAIEEKLNKRRKNDNIKKSR